VLGYASMEYRITLEQRMIREVMTPTLIKYAIGRDQRRTQNRRIPKPGDCLKATVRLASDKAPYKVCDTFLPFYSRCSVRV